MACDVRLHQSCFILSHNSPGVTTTQSDFAQDNMPAKKPEPNYFYQCYTLDKSTFKDDNLVLSNESKKRERDRKIWLKCL